MGKKNALGKKKGGGKRKGLKPGQSTSSNSCKGHSDLYKRFAERSAFCVPSDVSGLLGKENPLGMNLLQTAAHEDIALALAQDILKCGCISINSLESPYGQSPLLIASNHGQVNMVKLFLEQEGIDVNIKCIEGTPLIMAAGRGYLEIVKLLLVHGDIDVNLANITGFTALPLHCTAMQKRETVVQTLLTSVTIDVNNQGRINRSTPFHLAGRMTALHRAAQEGRTEVVKLLLTNEKIDVNVQDYAVITPLHIAARNGDIEAIKLLLNHKAIDVNLGQNLGRTALIFAVNHRKADAVKLLVGDSRVDVNKIKEADCVTNCPLSIAASMNLPEIVTIILNFKLASIEPISIAQSLWWASGNGSTEVVRVLLDLCQNLEHFDVEKKNSKGETALNLAQSRNHPEVVEVITKHIKKIKRRKQREIGFAEMQEAIAAFDTLD